MATLFQLLALATALSDLPNAEPMPADFTGKSFRRRLLYLLMRFTCKLSNHRLHYLLVSRSLRSTITAAVQIKLEKRQRQL